MGSAFYFVGVLRVSGVVGNGSFFDDAQEDPSSTTPTSTLMTTVVTFPDYPENTTGTPVSEREEIPESKSYGFIGRFIYYLND